jgi:hypothetical protein
LGDRIREISDIVWLRSIASTINLRSQDSQL